MNYSLRKQGIKGSSSQGSRDHHLKDQEMNLKDLVMNVKDQELIITGIKGSSSYESRDHHLMNQGIIILGITESSF